jgi:hypothetical protein
MTRKDDTMPPAWLRGRGRDHRQNDKSTREFGDNQRLYARLAHLAGGVRARIGRASIWILGCRSTADQNVALKAGGRKHRVATRSAPMSRDRVFCIGCCRPATNSSTPQLTA